MDVAKPDYRIFHSFEDWTLRDALNIIISYCQYKADASGNTEYDENYIANQRSKIIRMLSTYVYTFSDDVVTYTDRDEYGYPFYDEFDREKKLVSFIKTKIDIERFLKFVAGENLPFPKELLDAFLERKNSNITKCVNDDQGGTLAGYEDILSDESILKLKDLPPDRMKQQVAILAAEKKKSDAAIIAATRIGLLFYEGSLSKPSTEKMFLEEYKEHFDKLPPLRDTTIKRIYKHLPEGYRRTADGGKVPNEQQDITPIIKAAVYAGSIYDTGDVKTLDKLKDVLALSDYRIPSDDILAKIIEAVKEV